jgi:hypothetical protein
MLVKDLIKELNKFNKEKNISIIIDYGMGCLMKGIKLDVIEDKEEEYGDKNNIIIRCREDEGFFEV